MRIRILSTPTRGEVDALAEIFDLYRTHYGEDRDVARSAAWLEENLAAKRITAFVAESDGTIVGFANTVAVPASLGLGRFWQIRDLFVLPTHRRLGIGRALLASVRTAAIAEGASRVVLQTEVDNVAALRLYADSGYEVVEGYRTLMLPCSM